MKVIGLALLGALSLFGPAVYAHHSHPDFLLDQDATVEGVIDSIQFKNPHVVIRFHTADSTPYTAEWQGATWLRHHEILVTPVNGAVNGDTLRAGDFIVVVGCPSRDPARHELVNLKAVRRPHDEWLWTCRRPDARNSC